MRPSPSLLRTAALASLLGLASCERGGGQSSTGQLEPLPNPHGELTPLPDPDLQEGQVGRSARRLTVAQLRRTIEIVVGRPWAGLERVAPSLGEADFAFLSSESTELNLVFAKFLEEGAREVCVATAESEQASSDPAARILSRRIPGNLRSLQSISPEDARLNLQYLSRRFWGAPLQGPELEEWAGLFQSLATKAQAQGKPERAFAALCIALMTDPRFVTY